MIENDFVKTENDGAIVFHRPLWVRALGIGLQIIFLAMFVYPVYDASLTESKSDLLLLAAGYSIPLGSMVVLLFFGNSPYNFSLDLINRTYILKKGYRFFERTHAGSFSDIENLQIRSKYSQAEGRVLYRIFLTWKQQNSKAKRPWIIVGSSCEKYEIMTLARQYAELVQAPLVTIDDAPARIR